MAAAIGAVQQAAHQVVLLDVTALQMVTTIQASSRRGAVRVANISAATNAAASAGTRSA